MIRVEIMPPELGYEVVEVDEVEHEVEVEITFRVKNELGRHIECNRGIVCSL